MAAELTKRDPTFRRLRPSGRWLAVLLAVLANRCQRPKSEVVRADPVTARDAGVATFVDASDDGGAPVGELLVPAARVSLRDADETFVRWTVDSIRPQIREGQLLFERAHRLPGELRHFSFDWSQSVSYIDPRWMIVYQLAFQESDKTVLVNRTTGKERALPLPIGCERWQEVVLRKRAYLVGSCWSQNIVYVFDPVTGLVSRWFDSAGELTPLAADADRFYYARDESLRVRSHSSGSDALLRLHFGSFTKAAVVGKDLFAQRNGTLERFPLDGSESSEVTRACKDFAADERGLVFAKSDEIFALDANASEARLVATVSFAELSYRRVALTAEWIYFAASDGVRRLLRH